MKSLYVGIDIHSRTHQVALLPLHMIEGAGARWKNVRTVTIGNNLDDYERVDALIKAQIGDGDDVSIAVDFTGGHYSEPITYFLKSRGYNVFYLTPMGVKAAKERFLGEENKTDNIDAATSAYLLYLRDKHGVSLHITATTPRLSNPKRRCYVRWSSREVNTAICPPSLSTVCTVISMLFSRKPRSPISKRCCASCRSIPPPRRS